MIDSPVFSFSFSVTVVGLFGRDAFLSLLPEIHAGALVLDQNRSQTLFLKPLSWVCKSHSVDKTWHRQKRCQLGNAAVNILLPALNSPLLSSLVGRNRCLGCGEHIWVKSETWLTLRTQGNQERVSGVFKIRRAYDVLGTGSIHFCDFVTPSPHSLWIASKCFTKLAVCIVNGNQVWGGAQ